MQDDRPPGRHQTRIPRVELVGKKGIRDQVVTIDAGLGKGLVELGELGLCDPKVEPAGRPYGLPCDGVMRNPFVILRRTQQYVAQEPGLGIDIKWAIHDPASFRTASLEGRFRFFPDRIHDSTS